MRPNAWIIALLAAILLSACTKIEPPFLGEPKPMALRAGKNVLGPRFSLGSDGTVLLSWMQREKKGATLRYSVLELGKWQAAKDVVTDENMFVNWADLPSVNPLDAHQWVAHWLSKSAPETYAYDILVAFSDDKGATWGDPIRPHTDGTPTEHGFASLFPWLGIDMGPSTVLFRCAGNRGRPPCSGWMAEKQLTRPLPIPKPAV